MPTGSKVFLSLRIPHVKQLQCMYIHLATCIGKLLSISLLYYKLNVHDVYCVVLCCVVLCSAVFSIERGRLHQPTAVFIFMDQHVVIGTEESVVVAPGLCLA